jgi:hypothetical protein
VRPRSLAKPHFRAHRLRRQCRQKIAPQLSPSGPIKARSWGDGASAISDYGTATA